MKENGANILKGKKLGHCTCMICLTFVLMAQGYYLDMHTQSNTIWIQVYDVNCEHATIFCYFPENV